jgi:hypothetical protein
MTKTTQCPGVKPWKFWLSDIQETKRDNKFPFYLCLYVPFAKDLSAKRRRVAEEEERPDAPALSRRAHGAGSAAEALEAAASGGAGAEERERFVNGVLDGQGEDAQQVQHAQHATWQVERCLGELVEALLERVRASGFLTQGEAQENLFRKSVERYSVDPLY